jgi:hypothetical protein
VVKAAAKKVAPAKKAAATTTGTAKTALNPLAAWPFPTGNKP